MPVISNSLLFVTMMTALMGHKDPFFTQSQSIAICIEPLTSDFYQNKCGAKQVVATKKINPTTCCKNAKIRSFYEAENVTKTM